MHDELAGAERVLTNSWAIMREFSLSSLVLRSSDRCLGLQQQCWPVCNSSAFPDLPLCPPACHIHTHTRRYPHHTHIQTDTTIIISNQQIVIIFSPIGPYPIHHLILTLTSTKIVSISNQHSAMVITILFPIYLSLSETQHSLTPTPRQLVIINQR